MVSQHHPTEDQLGIKKLIRLDVSSNIFFVIFGIVCAIFNLPIMFLISGVLLCIGSGIYHYKKTPLTLQADWSGMYMVFATLGAYAFNLPHSELVIIAITIALTAIDMNSDGKHRFYLLGGLSAALIAALLINFPLHEVFTIIYYYAVAFIPWFVTPNRESRYYRHFHGLWHILASYAIWKTAELIFYNFIYAT